MAVRVFFAGLIVLLVFLGCGGGGGGGGGGAGTGVLPVSPVVVSGTISGTISVDQTITALRPDISSFSPSLRFLDSFVLIEELPNVSTRADQDGKFVFENVPFGTYRIIARVTSLAGRIYKLRTTAQSLSQNDPQKNVAINVTPPDLAEHQIRMQIKDLNGNPVGKCKVWFWGEQFTVDANGYYLSPFMPVAAAGTIKVEPPADKQLSKLDFAIPATTFNPDNVEIIGVTLPTAGITNKAPIVSITTDKYPEEGSAFLRLFGNYSDPEGEPMTTSWITNVSTFTYIAKDYADWAVPSVSASVTVYFSASEDGRFYPRLTSIANLAINVASSGEVSFPGEILLRPVTRTVDIAGSATSQIPGNATAFYEAKPRFPPGLQLTYKWTVDRGTLLSSATESIITWRSPALSPGVTQVASIAVSVTDGIGTARKEIQVRVTSAPTVSITQPTATALEPGLITFTGTARDYLNTAISPDSMSWYVATDTQPFVHGQTGGATFSWRFLSQGSYTVALEAFDNNRVVGTGTKTIAIVNARPVCAITQPLNDASFRPNTPVTFVGTVIDGEDGPITDATRLVWTSDIDDVIGSGTTFTVANMTSSRHEIRFSATDSGGAVGSASIVIWYDVPARISFTPADRSVFFEGYNIPFAAVGTDTDNTPLDSSEFIWYLDDSPDIWRDVASFVISAGAYTPGAHRVRVEGPAKFEMAVSPTHVIQMGWPIASITSPASGTRFDPLDVVSFAATPDSTGTLTLEWYLNNETTSFGSGAATNFAPVNGAHRVTYIGTDSQGIVSSSTINIVIERVPILSFLPVSGSHLFTGHPVDFVATCLDSDNNDIAEDRVSWLFNGLSWATVSGTAFSRTQPEQLAAGTHDITLIAVGPFGTSASTTNRITVGIPAAAIVSPASNATFLPGTLINFEGTPDSTGPIEMEWWATYGAAAPIKIGNGATVATNTLPDGYPIITYMGTDSSGFVSSASRRIGIGQFPEMDFTPDEGTVFYGNQEVVFTGVGTDSIDGTLYGGDMVWHIAGAIEAEFVSTMRISPARAAELGAGLHEVTLYGTNSIGAVGAKTKQIYLAVPDPQITYPAYDTVIPLATLFTFTGSPDTISGAGITEPLTMRWLLNGAPLPTTGATLTYTLPGGIHRITYIGTDSLGIERSDTIQVIVSNDPTVTFSPISNTHIFIGKPFTLQAAGDIATATVEWSLDGGASVWKTGSPRVVAAGELAVGYYDITAKGSNAVGVVASRTNENIYYGHPLLTIASPTTGITVARSTAALTFEGSPANASATVNDINISWQRSNRTATSTVGGTTINNAITLDDGWNDITLTGQDVAGNQCVSTVSVLKNDPPTLTLWPADTASDAYFFQGRTAVFSGAGTSSISLAAVQGTTMKWRLSDAADKVGSSTATYAPAAQSPLNQWRTLTLEGTDDLGTSNISDPVDVWFGCPLAVISGPASGSVFNPGQTVTFSGNIDSTYPITMEWYRVESSTLLHTGNESFSLTASSTSLPVGRSTIRYQGTDSSGFTSSTTIQILVNASASMVIEPGDDAEFFKSRNVVLSGYGTSLGGQAIATSTFKWLVNGAQKATATNPVSLAFANFTVGENLVRLEGTDEFGVVSSITRRLYYGYSLASITSPASGTRFNEGQNIEFKAIDESFYSLTPEWLIDGSSYLTGVTSFNKADLGHGIRTVTYRIQDSSGFVSSATIQVLINNPPSLEITPADGGYFFAGHPVTIYGAGTSSFELVKLEPASLTWYVGSSPMPSGSTLTIAAGALSGEQKITLVGRDRFGTANAATFTYNFGYTVASITSPASGSLFDPSDSITFSAVPNTGLIPQLTMGWLLDGGVVGLPDNAEYTQDMSALSRGWHTMTYQGTDASGYISSSTVQFLVNRPPTMTFTPANGTVFFDNSPVTFSGSGESYLGAPGDITAFAWYVNGEGPRETGNNLSLASWMATADYYDVTLKGTDNYGTVGSITQTIYYKYPPMAIVSPEPGWVKSPGSQINLLGTSGVTGVIEPEWYMYGENFHQTPTKIADGANVVDYTLPAEADLYTFTYVATDSNNFATFATVKLTVNATIDPVIIPGENSTFFARAAPVTFIGSGTDANGDALPSANMKWKLNDEPLERPCDAGYEIYYDPGNEAGKLRTGFNKLQLTASDTLGATNSAILYYVYYGHPELAILSPASGTVTLDNSVTFTGVNASDSIRPGLIWSRYHSALGTDTVATQNHTASIALPNTGWYTISYSGTDTAGVWSTGTTMIFKNALPTVNFNTPAADSIFFITKNFTLEADGSEAVSGSPLSAAAFKWYKDADSGAFATNDTATALAADFSVGTHTLYVTGVDSYGTVATSSVREIYYGHPLLIIASPAGDIYIGNPGAGDIVFKGSLASVGIDIEWYLESAAQSEPGDTLTLPATSLSAGWNNIYYEGTDDAGNVSTASVRVLKSDRPSITFAPASNSVFFVGRNFSLEATANEALPPNNSITGNNIKWYRGSTQIATGTPVTVAAGSWTVGTHTIHVTAEDSNGVIATAEAQAFYYGHPVLTIASPSADIWINSGAPITPDFVGSTASQALALQWYRNGVAVGTTNPLSITLPSEDQYEIEYTGTDDAGNLITAAVSVLVRSVPVMSIDSPASGSHLFTVGTNQVTFTGSGVDTASMTWQFDARAPQTGVNPITFGSVTTGWHTVKLTGTYEAGVTSYTTSMFYYGHPALSIDSPASNFLIASDSPPLTVDFVGSSIMTPPTIGLKWYYKDIVRSTTTTWSEAGTTFEPGFNTIYYEGTDAAGTVSTATRVIRKRDEPEMIISTGTALTAGADYYFFTSKAVPFYGSGLDVNAASMSWYLNGSLSHSNTSTANFASIAVGDHTLRLNGTDIYGLASYTVINIHGVAQAAISQPVAQRYDIGDITLEGTPDTFGSTTMKWYLDYGLGSERDLVVTGTGPHFPVNIPVAERGNRTITYVGTDDNGFISSKTVQILVDTPPTMTITKPATNPAFFFGGQSIELAGTGQTSEPAAITETASLTWYRVGTTSLGNGLSITVPVSGLPTGTYNIRFEGKDEFGITASATCNVTTGLALPKITNPASGTRFDLNQLATFTGTDLSGKIDMEWHWLEKPLPDGIFGVDAAAEISTFTRGWQTISYIGTDSAVSERSDKIMVLVDSLPTFTTPPRITSSVKFADGPEYGGAGNYIPIHLITPGAISVSFEAYAQHSGGGAIPDTNMKWYLGATYEGTGNTKTFNFENPGSATIRVAATDEYNVTATATFVFWLWETETYFPAGLTSPSSIIKIDENNLAVADVTNRKIYKLLRDSANTPIVDRGDLSDPSTSTVDVGAGLTLVDISTNTTDLIALVSWPAVEHYFQKYNKTSFAFNGQVVKPNGLGVDDALDSPQGIAVDGSTAIYISDSGNKVIKKFDLAGNYISKSLSIENPYGIKYVGTDQIYVADNFSKKLFRYKNLLNLDASWNSAVLTTDVAHLTKGSPNNYFYVTDPVGKKINVLDSTGNYVYSFGDAGTFSEPFGIVIANSTGYYDMYITDRTGNKIVRFRSNAW